MNVLVINCGSSSLKYQLINSDTEAVLAKGLCERIGIDGRLTYQKAGLDKEITEAPMPTHKEAIQLVLHALVNDKTGAIKDLSEVNAVGHRIVHGGEKFASSAVITDDMLAAVEECNDLAPLHNPANLIGINACRELMPGVPMVGVFDTAFHQTMPEKAYLYGLPYEYYEKYKVRRYGFHGTSHSFVSKHMAKFLGMDLDDLELFVARGLDFAKSHTSAEKQVPLDIRAFLQSIVDDVALDGTHVPLEADPVAGPLLVKARPSCLKRCVNNLLNNALTYADSARVRILVVEDMVRIEISDNGPGIPDDKIERVFMPYYRLDNSRNTHLGGTGLGLSIARNMAALDQAKLSLRNNPGGGLTASIEIPRYFRSAPAAR